MAIPDHIFRPLADQYNPRMLNRFETDENPYNICLTSADKTSSSEFKRIQTDRVFVIVIVFVTSPP